jgi:hypothetical protein
VDADFGESQNAITGECSIEDNSNFYNRMLFVFRQVKQHYDKRRHLAGEDKVYTMESKN